MNNLKKFFSLLLVTMLIVLTLVPSSFAATNATNNVLYAVDKNNPDIIKADLTKLPKMYNSEIESVQATQIDNEIKIDLKLQLAPNEKRKDSRMIEFNKKTLITKVETGTLEDPALESANTNPSVVKPLAYTYSKAAYYTKVTDPVGIVCNAVNTILYFSYNGSNVGSFSGEYSQSTYHGITNWYLNYANNSASWWNSPLSAYSHTNAAFYNYDFMDPNLITTATYTDHSVLGAYDGTINGWVGLNLQGEYYWLLGYSSSLQRVY